MRITTNRAVASTVAFFLTSSAALFAVGNLLTDRALFLVSESRSSHLRSMSELADPTIPRSQTIRWLEENGFFQRKIFESPEVIALKRAGGMQDLDRYFHNPWDLVRYLDFVGERRMIYDLLSAGLRTKIFVNRDKCSADPGCEDTSGTLTVNDEQVDRLIEALRTYYLDPAVKLYEAGAISDAQRILGDLSLLLRSVHFDGDRSLGHYNDILVVTAFLSRGADVTMGRAPSPTDLSTLRRFVGSSLPSGEKPAHRQIADYMNATSLLRKNCFVAASQAFAASLDKLGHEPLKELFAFMSLRSLARPFVDLSRLRLGVDNKIHVLDCDKVEEAGVYKSLFDANLTVLRDRHIKHAGLRGDLRLYGSLFPSTADRSETLLAQIRVLESVRLKAEDSRKETRSEASTAPTATDEKETTEIVRSDVGGSESRAESKGNGPTFRWPARGRIIAPFSGRGGNEGINIALTEGTLVHAAEAGTVAYAGSELKGYGLIVLIRHPNGYVTAYAHNGEMLVKRGDVVKRGQPIAKSGQSGNVSSPQLRFELRQGSTPVDPTRFLRTDP